MPSIAKPQPSRSPLQSLPVTKNTYRDAKQTVGKESLAAIAHDARNVVAALRLYCDLLAEPGVLSAGHEHFAAELQAVAAASSGLVEQLAALSVAPYPKARESSATVNSSAKTSGSLPYIDDLAAAVRQLEGPLATMAGSKIDLQVESLPCPGRIRLSQEGLTRILINLTRNAAEAMPQGGRIRITVQQGDGGNFLDRRPASAQLPRTVLLCVQDSGSGISDEQMQHLFEAGFTTKGQDAAWTSGAHRGLGLSIVHRLAEAAGGCVRAISAPGRGARFEVELPLIYRTRANSAFIADFTERANIEC
jgi:signal transduction histidine kinase